MSKKLTVTETYRLNSESEVEAFIDNAKQDSIANGYILTKYSSAVKEKKKKGEVIDEGYLVTLSKQYDTFFNEDLL